MGTLRKILVTYPVLIKSELGASNRTFYYKIAFWIFKFAFFARRRPTMVGGTGRDVHWLFQFFLLAFQLHSPNLLYLTYILCLGLLRCMDV